MRQVLLSISLALLLPLDVAAQSINFGDDSSQWANEGECDDRRFYGTGMSSGLDRDDIGHDATDCRVRYEEGEMALWDFAAAKAATQCDSINFGDDNSEWPSDNKCDDARFDGPGSDYVLLPKQTRHDATDCRKLCALGQIALRNY